MAARMREQLAVGLASSPVGERGVPATVPPLGTAYKEAQPNPSAAERQPFDVDPALVERSLRGHAHTQVSLAGGASAA